MKVKMKMKMNVKVLCLLILSFVFFINHSSVSAYSYGKPDQENMADAYAAIHAKLNKSPIDWAGIQTDYNAIKDEIAKEQYFRQHAPNIAVILDNHIQRKEKDLLMNNFQGLLYLNLERRMHYTAEVFDDYSRGKLLLAKGYGTFRVLKPFIAAKVSASAAAEVDKSLQLLLEALGNPGLFGIGKKPSDRSLYDQEMNKVIKLLKTKFPIKINTQKTVILTLGSTIATVNNSRSTLEDPPYIKLSRTYVPVRFVSESLGAKVEWLASTSTVRITSGSTIILLPIGQATATVNGTRRALDAPAEIVNSRTFVPVRFVSEVLGYKVDWNQATQTVRITGS